MICITFCDNREKLFINSATTIASVTKVGSRCATIKLHIEKDKNVCGKLGLLHVGIDRRRQYQVKHGFDIGIRYLVVSKCNADFVAQRLAVCKINEL